MRSADADEIVIASLYRSNLPLDEQLSTGRLVEDLIAHGQHARYVPSVDEIVALIAAEHKEGDLVVLMSNGGFGGIHVKLLKALRS